MKKQSSIHTPEVGDAVTSTAFNYFGCTGKFIGISPGRGFFKIKLDGSNIDPLLLFRHEFILHKESLDIPVHMNEYPGHLNFSGM